MRKLMARWQAWRDGRQFVVVGTQSHWPIWRGAESNGAAMTEIGLRADGVGARPVAPAWLAYGLSLSPNWPGLRLRSLLQRIDMTRFVLELKGPAEGDLATLGRAQSKVIVGLDDEITALVKKAATFGLTLTGEPRFVLEHKKPALPGNPGGPAPLPSSVEVADLDEKRAADGGATVHPRRHGSAAAAE